MVRAGAVMMALSVVVMAGSAEGGTASSAIVDTNGRAVGNAVFADTKGGVEVRLKVWGLPPGKHGMHLHEKGVCERPGFASAGSHFNPFTRHHGAKNPEGKHAGDLPNLEVRADGSAEMTAIAEGATLADGPASLLGPGGSSLVIHAQADDEKSDPSGKSGDRIACGVIVPR